MLANAQPSDDSRSSPEATHNARKTSLLPLCACVCVCVNACTWRLTLPASRVHIRWFASATQQFYLPAGYAQTFSPSRTGSADSFLFPQGERKGMRQHFFLPAREARTVFSFTVNMQGPNHAHSAPSLLCYPTCFDKIAFVLSCHVSDCHC